jgi:hypothetical protein
LLHSVSRLPALPVNVSLSLKFLRRRKILAYFGQIYSTGQRQMLATEITLSYLFKLGKPF